MSKTDFKAQKKWVKKNSDTGLVRVNVWVPESASEELKSIASDMRREFKAAS